MIRLAVQRPAMVWATCLMLLLGGSIAATRLPFAPKTTVELPRLTVAASWPGAAPEVIESHLTAPVEAAVQGVRGVKRVSSTSSDDQARWTVELERGADVQMTRLAILERLELLRRDLPLGASIPTVTNYVPEALAEAPLLSITLTGPYTSGTLEQLLEERINPRLAAVQGVGGLRVRGGTARGISVTYDPAALRRLGVSPDQLVRAVTSARLVQPLGLEPRGSFIRTVVLRDEPRSVDDLRALPVPGPGGRVFSLGELASVRTEEDAQGRFLRVNGTPAVAVDVTRDPGADAAETATLLRDVVRRSAPHMPRGAHLAVTADESVELVRQLRMLGARGSLAFAGVLLVLVLVLRRLRAVGVVIGVTVVALAATALTLYLWGVPANLLTLAGVSMGLGMLVQNAVVVLQRLSVHAATPTARADATRAIAPAVVGSTLTTGVVLLPFLYLQGDTRAAFMPFASAFVLALAWSVIAALLVIPTIGGGLTHRTRLWRRPRRAYLHIVHFLLHWRAWTLAVTGLVLCVLTWGFMTKIPRDHFTGVDERRTALTVSLEFPRGSDPGTLETAMRTFERTVLGHPAVDLVRTQAYSSTRADMQVAFTRTGGQTAAPTELQELLTQRAVLVGGGAVSVHGEGPGFSSGSTSAASAVSRIRVTGYSYDGVVRLCDDLRVRLERVRRIRDIRVSTSPYVGSDHGAQITLTPDRAALARNAITATALAGAIGRQVRGVAGRELVEVDGDELPVRVQARGARDRDLAELADAFVPTATGAPVRIISLAAVEERASLSAILREDQEYVRYLSYDFRGPPALAHRTHRAFMRTIAVPAGYAVTDVSNGVAFGTDQSERGLWVVVGIGLLLVVLSVALVFDSMWGAAVVFLSLPMCLGGVVAAFWITGAPFTRDAAIGVILVVGLSVNHAILLVDAALRRRHARRDAGLHADLSVTQVLRACADRSGLIVLVTLTSLASLAPFALDTDATELFGAIALATAGGTVAGTLGALFVLPVLLAGARQREVD